MLLQEVICILSKKSVNILSQLGYPADNNAYPVDVFRSSRYHSAFRIVAGEDGHAALAAQSFAYHIAIRNQPGDNDFVGGYAFKRFCRFNEYDISVADARLHGYSVDPESDGVAISL